MLKTEPQTAGTKRPRTSRKKAQMYLRQNYDLYLMLLPTLVFILVFSYIPMYGIVMAFQDFNPIGGFTGSPWVGLKHFVRFFATYSSRQTIANTVVLSLYSLITYFPLPILLALLLNYSTSKRFARFVQTVTYMPNFISTMVLVGMLNLYFSPNYGIFNTFLGVLGIPSQAYMSEPEYFRHIYVWSGHWQGTGFGSIIYFAALSAIDTTLYEAATLDGATKVQRIWYIDLPGILPTCVIMLILSFGNVMSVGFEKAYLMQNARNSGVSEIISTYVYKVGLIDGRFSFSAAVGLFNTIVNFILLVSINWISKKVSDTSLW